MGILLPKTTVNNITEPVIFLAGPIKGAPLWQDKAIEIILAKENNLCVASPSKHLRQEYLDAAVKGNAPDFERQLPWEREYLDLAAKTGAILFWLPVQEKESIGRPYARDTRGELGEWRGRAVYEKNTNIVIGGEEGFDGLDVIKRNYSAIIPNMKFYSTLEETCDEAVRLALLKKGA